MPIAPGCGLVGGGRHDGAMVNLNLNVGSVWRLHRANREIVRLTVIGADMPWVHGTVETLVGFEEFRSDFHEQEQAIDEEDWERADACYDRIRAALTMTFPDGGPVPEFMLRIHGDGTAGWRWHDQPFDAASDSGE